MNEETSQISDSPSSSSQSPLVARRTPRPTIFSRLSNTISQVIDSPAPPPTSLAPPASPDGQPHCELVDRPEVSHATSRTSTAHTPPSGLAALLDRLKVSLLLENSGSVARDHLAAERTFLAYVRTSLVIASTGVALVQLFTIANATDNKLAFVPTVRRIQAWARPLGATMVCFGLVVLTLGTIRYFRIQSALTQGMFPVARLTAASITFVLGTIIIVVFAILLSARG